MKFLPALLFCLFIAPARAQYKTGTFSNAYRLQYGFSLKGTLEVGVKNSDAVHPRLPALIYRFTAGGGVASHFVGPWLYPALNGELQFYNGGIGSRNRIGARERHRRTLDFILAFTATAGGYNYFVTGKEERRAQLPYRNVPLYYFADFGYPALQNPYRYSGSVGTNVVLTTDRKRAVQRIGFVGFNARQFQISSYNDGGQPFRLFQVGDRKDRYYTGGGVLSYHGDTRTYLNLIELSYHKFTGYTKNAFEVSNKLQLARVNYSDEEQQYFNKSVWSITLADPARGWGVSGRMYHYLLYDVQHLLHWGLFNAYHLVPYKPHFALNGSYYFNPNRIGLQ